MITTKEIEIYRNIYYENFKPILNGRFSAPKEEVEEKLKPILLSYGWSIDKYLSFCQIDLAQRFSKTKSELWLEKGEEPKIELRFGDTSVGALDFIEVPELKCPRRTTQK